MRDPLPDRQHAPVAYGALGTPITALEAVTGINATLISKMAARTAVFLMIGRSG